MHRRLRRLLIALSLPILLLTVVPALAQDTAPVHPDSSLVSLQPVVTGLTRPLFVTHAADGSGRLFLVEQGGKIRVIADGQTLETPFLDIAALISPEATATWGYTERGLLGLAFHPLYAENGRFFVNYTDLNGNTVVARYQVSDDPNVADPASGQIIFTAQQPFANHNGGHLAFGPDGALYIALGDGGSQGDPMGNGQNLGSVLGKILRIDVDAADGGGYVVPADNPFVSTSGAAPEIWAYGLRNPWRFSFDRETGDLWIGDVGGSAWEEVNFQAADWPGGANYGWNRVEGMHPTGAGDVPANAILPVAEYSHNDGISISGGYVYRGEAIPALQGVYLYGDFGSGIVWSLVPAGDGAFSSQKFLTRTGLSISSFGEDEAGELYIVDYNGQVLRIEPSA